MKLLNSDSLYLSRLLNYYITQIYENEKEFLDYFFDEFKDELELVECYFASERVKLIIIDTYTGNNISTTIQFSDVCDWVDKLNYTPK